MLRGWSLRLALLGACLALGCKDKSTPPRAVVDDVPAALEQAGAVVDRDTSRQAKPVIAVSFVNRSVSDDTVALLKSLPNLRTVSFRDCPEPPPSHLKEVILLPGLRNLYLSGCTWVTDADLKDVTRHKTLQRLNLNGCTGVTDAGVKELAVLKELVLLELGGCKQVSNGALTPLAPLAKLRRLGLGGCDKVTDAGEQDLKKILPDCIVTREDYDATRTGVR